MIEDLKTSSYLTLLPSTWLSWMTVSASATSASSPSVASGLVRGRRARAVPGVAGPSPGVAGRRTPGTGGGCAPLCCAMTKAGSEIARRRSVASAVEILFFTKTKPLLEPKNSVGHRADGRGA